MAMENPKEKANFLSLLFLGWMYSLMKLANQRPLTVDDLYGLSDEDKAENIVEDFEETWRDEKKRAYKCGRQPRIWKAFFRFIPCRDYVCMITLRTLESLSVSASVVLLWLYLECALTECRQNTWYLFAVAVGISLSNVLRAFVIHHNNLKALLVGTRLETACIGITYKKVLESKRYNLTQESAGQVFNLVSNDAKRLQQVMMCFWFSSFAFLDTLLAVVLLCAFAGWESLTGVAVVIFFSIIQYCISLQYAKCQGQQAVETDKRLTIMNEVITGIRAVKVYAMEWMYRDVIRDHIRKEKWPIVKSKLLTSFSNTVAFSLNPISTMVCVIIMMYSGIQIIPVNAFTITTILSFLSLAFNAQFYGFNYLSDAYVSIKRIEQYLLDHSSIEEYHDNTKYQATGKPMEKPLNIFSRALQNVISKTKGESQIKYTALKKDDDSLVSEFSQSKDGSDPHLELIGVSSGWSHNSATSTIHNISLQADSNKLVMIIGQVGSGKSTLLTTILHEIPVMSGHISSSGKIAYVSQIAWIFTGTVRENILFGEMFDQSRYQKVIDACDLNHDIELFPKGDLTTIGSRGVGLSGGQRIRVSLARAVYSNADIFLLDDPLSAVDAKVGQHLFEKCICGELSEKIRILVTHQLQHLHRADEILILKEGAVLKKGSFDEISESQGLSQYAEDPTKLDVAVPGIKQVTKAKDKRKSDGKRDLYQEDEDDATTYTWRLYWHYLRAGLPALLIVMMLLFAVVAQVSIISPSWWLKVMSKMTYQKQKSATVLGIYGGVVVGSLILTALSTLMLYMALLRSSSKLHEKMTLAILKAPVLFFDTNPVGRIINRFSKDIGTMNNFLPNSIGYGVLRLFNVLVILMITIILNYWFVFAVIFEVIGIYLVIRFYIKPARELSRLESLSCSPVYAHISETIDGLEVIHSLQMEVKSVERLYSLNNLRTQSLSLVFSINVWNNVWVDFVTVLFVTIVCISTVFLPFDAATTGFLLANVISMVRMVTNAMRYTTMAEIEMVAVERVRQYTLLESEPGYARQRKPPKDWPDKGSLSVEGLSMVYLDGGQHVLKDVHFDVKPLEHIGIAGRTGAGKSSLVAALFRMPDPQGRVLIDGVDLGTLDIQEVRMAMSVISQNPILFSGTLKYNLDPCNHFTEEQIWTALEQVQMNERVNKLPGLLDYPIGKNGSSFSVGETQLLCLARALLRRCKILILDEATANVDYETDHLVQQVLREKFCNCTVLTIAHRLNTIMDYDKVLVLDQGHVVEYDSPDVLIAKSDGVFAELVRSHNGSH